MLRNFVLIVSPWVLVILVWYAVAYSGIVNPSLVPTPHQVASKFWQLLTTARLPMDIFMSTQRVFLGVTLFVMYYLLIERPVQSLAGFATMMAGLLIYAGSRALSQRWSTT